uniref:Uncharacterized protein n=1 Tax=Arundo donax TaxID=35708 RepID=A0A0A9BQ37_ARUDO
MGNKDAVMGRAVRECRYRCSYTL